MTGHTYSVALLSAGLRDMACFGELVRNKGLWQGEQIIPAAAIEDIERGAVRQPYFAAPISRWVSGQTLFVNGGGVQTLD